MSIDRAMLRQKLESLSNSLNKTSNKWKPVAGKTTVRIVPYKYNKSWPFIDLYFHYNLGSDNLLSPISFGKPDPIVEFAQRLKEEKTKESYELSKKLSPKLRTYTPIVVRGEEDAGIKFWGFGKRIYTDLLALIDDEEYGDITDVNTGTDLIVEYVTPEDAGNTYGEISVRPKRSPSKLSDNSKVVDKLLNDQIEITEIFQLREYDELKDYLEKWLSADGGEQNEEETEEKAKEEEVISNVSNRFKKLYEEKE